MLEEILFTMLRIAVVLGLSAGIGIFAYLVIQRADENHKKEILKKRQYLEGEHRLRRMTERTEVSSKISGGFFLFAGVLSGKTTSNTTVKFAWEMNDGIYAFSSLPLEKIRVRIDEEVTTPTIRFVYNAYGWHWNPANVQRLIDSSVDYAILTVKNEDWPAQVELPLNSQQ